MAAEPSRETDKKPREDGDEPIGSRATPAGESGRSSGSPPGTARRGGLIPPEAVVSASAPYPLYRQVKNLIVERIKAGEWGPETRVPSENELVELLQVSRMTINRALRELSAEGYLLRLQGVGTFVARPKPQGALVEIRSVAEEIAEWGGRHSSEVILLAEEKASTDLALVLGLKEGGPVFHSIIVHRGDGLPVQLSDRFVNPAVAPQYLEQDFASTTPGEYLLRVAPLQEAEQIIEAALPDEPARRWLEIGPEEPCLVIHRRTWALGLAATKSRLICPGSRYRLGGRFKAENRQRPKYD
ncbi:MAG: histidine utilization repressor [Thermodesulfobacteriota bacterium]